MVRGAPDARPAEALAAALTARSSKIYPAPALAAELGIPVGAAFTLNPTLG